MRSMRSVWKPLINYQINTTNNMRIQIDWSDGTYTFKHGNEIATKSTLQNKKVCDNITREINEMFKQLEI